MPHVEPFTLAVYCPLLSENDETRALDNILYYYPENTNVNMQMNTVGFHIAAHYLASRFGSRSLCSSVCSEHRLACTFSLGKDLWLLVETSPRHSSTAVHRLLEMCLQLFVVLHYTDTLWEELCTPRPRTPDKSRPCPSRDHLQSYFRTVAAFLRTSALSSGEGAPPRGTPLLRPSWAALVRAETPLGYPAIASTRSAAVCGGCDRVVQRRLAQEEGGDVATYLLLERETLTVLAGTFAVAEVSLLKFYFLVFGLPPQPIEAHMPAGRRLCAVDSSDEVVAVVVLHHTQAVRTPAEAQSLARKACADATYYLSTRSAAPPEAILEGPAGAPAAAGSRSVSRSGASPSPERGSTSRSRPRAAQAVLWSQLRGGLLTGTPLWLYPAGAASPLALLLHQMYAAVPAGGSSDDGQPLRRRWWVPQDGWWLCVSNTDGTRTAACVEQSVGLSPCFDFVERLESV